MTSDIFFSSAAIYTWSCAAKICLSAFGDDRSGVVRDLVAVVAFSIIGLRGEDVRKWTPLGRGLVTFFPFPTQQ